MALLLESFTINYHQMRQKGHSTWQGTWHDGAGTISTSSGSVKEYPYTYHSRFEVSPGAGPEELLAAAHAACFNQALTNMLGQAGFTAELLNTSVTVELGRDEHGKLKILQSHIVNQSKVQGVSKEDFEVCAELARNGCAISKVLKCAITLEASLF